MSQKMIRICDKCRVETDTWLPNAPGGWRSTVGKDLCPVCYESFQDLEIRHEVEIKEFFGEVQKGGG